MVPLASVSLAPARVLARVNACPVCGAALSVSSVRHIKPRYGQPWRLTYSDGLPESVSTSTNLTTNTEAELLQILVGDVVVE